MTDYELIDAGGGARLERFGDRLVDRPSPAGLGPRLDPDAWAAADLFFDPDEGWRGPGPTEPWPIELDGVVLELRPTSTGQVGVFPEQSSSWAWLRDQVDGTDATVLDLFAYTGASTLVLAQAGAAVTHVDASRPAVAWARRNAELSGLGDRSIRWIVDDARAYAAREVRRGRSYDGVLLDPPTYGHGARNRTWQLAADLPALLADVAMLVRDRDGFVLLTAHTPGYGPGELASALGEALGADRSSLDSGDLTLTARSGRMLDLGAFARRGRQR